MSNYENLVRFKTTMTPEQVNGLRPNNPNIWRDVIDGFIDDINNQLATQALLELPLIITFEGTDARAFSAVVATVLRICQSNGWIIADTSGRKIDYYRFEFKPRDDNGN